MGQKSALFRRGAGIMNWFAERFELSRGGSAHNIRPMEGLRGFAALLVFVTHYCGFVRPYLEQSYLDKSSPFAQVFSKLDFIGNSGVDLFFVLSGYLIYGSLIARPQEFGRFMSRRVTRIYPVFLTVFLLYIPLSFVFTSENKIPASLADAAVYLVANLFLTVPLLVPFNPLVNVSWSLSYEMFYYALTPLVITLGQLRQRSAAWRITFFSALALAYAATCALYGGHPRLLMFIAGILLFEIIKQSRIRAPGSALTLLLVGSGLVVYTLPLGEQASLIRAVALFVSYFALCFCCFAHPSAWLRRAFEWTPFRWFGNMSYSFYMIHALAMQAAFLLLAKVIPASADRGILFFLALLPVQFIASLLPALALYLLIERRFSLTTSPRPRDLETPTPAQAQPAAPAARPRTAPAPALALRPYPKQVTVARSYRREQALRSAPTQPSGRPGTPPKGHK